MPTKRVLHVLPHRGGGGEVYVASLDAMSDFAHEPFYLSAGRTPGSAFLSLPLRMPRLLAKMRGADLLHVHGDAAAILTAPYVANKPSVITLHGLHLLRRSTGAAATAVSLGLRGAVAASDAVIACSEGEVADLAGALRTGDRSKVRVILNGVRAPAPIAEHERRHSRDALRVDDDAVLGLFVGELEGRKEPLLATAAARAVRAAGMQFRLAVAGDGPLAGAVGAVAGEAVEVLGFRSDVARLMSAADVFVQTASREGMSLALLEAMSHGLAIVASDVPGNAEAVGDAGLLFAAGDQDALTEMLTRLVSDRELRIELGAAAKRRATERFGLDRFVEEITDVYSAVLRSG